MTTPSDLTQTGEELLYALLNAANPTPGGAPFSAATVTIAAITPITGDPNGHNTKVTLNAVPGGGYSGTVDITLTRLDLVDVFTSKGVGSLALMNTDVGYARSHDLHAFLNSTYGLNLQDRDTVDEALPAPDGTTGEIAYSLAAAADSLTYIGSLPLTVTPFQLALAAHVQNNVLPGFTAVDANAIELKSAVINNQFAVTVADVTTPAV